MSGFTHSDINTDKMFEISYNAVQYILSILISNQKGCTEKKAEPSVTLINMFLSPNNLFWAPGEIIN